MKEPMELVNRDEWMHCAVLNASDLVTLHAVANKKTLERRTQSSNCSRKYQGILVLSESPGINTNNIRVGETERDSSRLPFSQMVSRRRREKKLGVYA
jgi:hypothetical protein